MYFGVIISGRSVITEAQIVPPNKVVFTIPAAPVFSHIVVFLLPGQSLPDGHAAAAYLEIPPSPEFKLLGAIANEKPSAIFKVNKPDAALAGGNVVLGFSIEPVEQVTAALAESGMKPSFSSPQTAGMEVALVRSDAGVSPATTKELAKRIIQNAYNFLSSFSGNVVNGIEVVPLKSFSDWWAKFERRIEQDPGFLERPQE